MDNRERTERLREEARQDIPLGGRVHRFVSALQGSICRALEQFEPEARFSTEPWTHSTGGGGLTRVLSGGTVFEKAGVNTSAVQGILPARMAIILGVTEAPYFATGISLVLHPASPFVPAVHANLRYFALGDDPFHPLDQWFGGGADLTPCYPYLEDVQHFHQVWKDVCDAHDAHDYAACKEACDRYFFLPHRSESRGVGGIFFDYVRDDPEGAFFFVREVGRAFTRAYTPIVERRRNQPWNDAQRTFLEIRRGRYAEFNLLLDRGTRFGIETGGRTESILMSLPPRVRWEYDYTPDPGTPEAAASWFFQPRDWLSFSSAQVPGLY